MKSQKLFCLSVLSIALAACGGGGGSGGGSAGSTSGSVSSASSNSSSGAQTSSQASSQSSSQASSQSSSQVSSQASSQASSQSSSQASSQSSSQASSQSSSQASSSSSSATASSAGSSAANGVLSPSMLTGWRGNGVGNSGISYTATGVRFAASGDNFGAVTDLAKPVPLENAKVDVVVSVSPEFKASGASLQIFAQIKSGAWPGEWDCWSGNQLLLADKDISLNCQISEADKKFDQSVADVQIGIQAKGSPAGTVTVKSITVTPAQSTSQTSSSSSSSTSTASVNSLRDLAVFPVGVAVYHSDFPAFNILNNPSEQAIVKKHFDQMTAGNIMKMSYLQPTQGNFTFSEADAFVDFAKSNNMSVHGHALVWHNDYQVPGFMKSWSGSSASFIAALEAHVSSVVTHFKNKGNVNSWDVVNEVFTDDNPSDYRKSDSVFYLKSGNSPVYIEKAFLAARAAAPSVTLYYNDYNIEANNSKTRKLEEMLDDFIARKIPIDGVGFQMHVCLNWPSIGDITQSMKRMADRGLKVKITELDVAINQPYCDSYPANKIRVFSQEVAQIQKKRYCEIVKAYLDVVPVSQRGGLSVWGTTDANTWLDDLYKQEFNNEKISWPLLFDNQYKDKPALRGVADALQGFSCNN